MLATGKCMYVMAKLTCAWWRIGRSLPSSGTAVGGDLNLICSRP